MLFFNNHSKNSDTLKRFPATNVLNDDPLNFWATNGMFPQEILFKVQKKDKAEKMEIISTNSLPFNSFLLI